MIGSLMNTFIKSALDNLKSSPLKVTSQRVKIVSILFQKGNSHHTAEDVHKLVKKKGLNISLATVYNTLNLFSEHGILKILRVPGDKFYFDTNLKPHHHFFCKKSEKLIDIKDSEIVLSKVPKPPKGKAISSVQVFVNLD
tara:strand:+ start:119 stop:538 length:420 start_codon:yes stop_codon:yes gene_type:complete